MDYGELDVLLTFGSCETRKCVNVSILDDGPGEPDEFFTYHLMRTSNLHPTIELDPVDGQVQIYDGDGELLNIYFAYLVQAHVLTLPAVNITLGYNSTLYTTSESRRNVELMIEIIHPPGGAPRPFTLLVNTHSDTAS